MTTGLGIDREYLIGACQQLVRINSVNPLLVPGAPGEGEIARWIEGAFRQLGLETTRHEPVPGRPTVVGRLRGQGGGRSLMLNAHVDTVGIDGMIEPFSGRLADGRVYGRGSFDMKGSLAASLAAAKALRDAGASLRGDLVLAAVADEEYGSLGTMDLVTHTRTDAAIVTEPTANRICLAHKGYLWLAVETVGRAAHGSRFAEGVDANLRMGRFLSRLDTLERELRSRAPHPLVGPPSLHAATLSGGTGLSTYADRCRLEIERRTVPGETEAGAVAEIEGILARLQAEDPAFEGQVECFFARQPFEVAPDALVVTSLASAAEEVLGTAPPMIGDTPWMDAALLAAAGVETVVFGPAGAGAHAAEEWVEVESMVACAEILARTAVAYCR